MANDILHSKVRKMQRNHSESLLNKNSEKYFNENKRKSLVELLERKSF